MNLLLLLLIPVGLVVGIVSAAFGIGGGLMMVPIMVLAYGLDQHAAQGTSLVVIVPTAIAGVIAHQRRGLVTWHLALLMSIGGVVGVLIGSGVALGTEAEALELVFAAVVVLAGLRLIVQGRRASRPGD